jgi:hypothetical protein
MKIIPRASSLPFGNGEVLSFRLLLVICVIAVICGSTLAAQKPQHTGTKLEGFATIVTSDSITVFDKKNQMVEVHTDKDYSALVGIAAPVTVWYTTEGGINHLEDIEYPKQAGTFVPPDLIRENIKRIIILPRTGGVDDSQGLVKAISKYLADNTGWYVAPPELAAEIASRTKSSNSPLDAIDPDTGQVDMQRYLEPQRGLMSMIANETRSDAVLEINIVKVKANVRSGIASWDDMTEPVASRKARSLTPWEGMSKGWVSAVTADMNLWSQSGKLLWKKRRGFAVLGVQSGMGGKYRERPLKEVYDDTAAMQRWLVATLSQLAPPTRGTTAEPQQVYPEVQKQLEKAKQAGEEQK